MIGLRFLVGCCYGLFFLFVLLCLPVYLISPFPPPFAFMFQYFFSSLQLVCHREYYLYLISTLFNLSCVDVSCFSPSKLICFPTSSSLSSFSLVFEWEFLFVLPTGLSVTLVLFGLKAFALKA